MKAPIVQTINSQTEPISRDIGSEVRASRRNKHIFLLKLFYLLQAVRPQQWTKNLIILIPIIFAGKATELRTLCITIIYALAFCLASSASYLFNDLLDRDQDRVHPKKSERPIASGKIGVGVALMAAAILAAVSLILSILLQPCLALIILVYLLLTVLYGTVLKHQVALDVMAVAAGFVMRALGGCLAAMVPASAWFLLCTSIGALFLALEKRRHEIATLTDSAHSHRSVLSAYSRLPLDRIKDIVLPSLLICYIFYSFLSYHGEWMIIAVPFVFYGLVRYHLLSDQGLLTGAPEEILLKDRPIQITVTLWILAVVGVIYGFIPKIYQYCLNRILN